MQFKLLKQAIFNTAQTDEYVAIGILGILSPAAPRNKQVLLLKFRCGEFDYILIIPPQTDFSIPPRSFPTLYVAVTSLLF